MDGITKKKQFLQLQLCVLLLACTLLPEFSFFSIGGGSSIPVMVAKIVAVICGGMALFSLNSASKLPVPYLCATGGGILAAFITLFWSPFALELVALIALFIGLWLGKESVGINWKLESTQGAYLILLATLVHFYYNMDEKLTVSIAAFVALIIYIKALKKFGTSMDEEGQLGVSKLKVAAWIGIIASAVKFVLGWIPLIGFVIGIIAGILMIISFIFEFIGYGKLTRSATLGNEGQQGAGKLRTSMILVIVAAIVGIIPLVGLVGKILTIIAIWFVFQGWNKIILGLERE